MDLIATLRTKLNSLEKGEYTNGLNATILHIDTAFRHLNRGQSKQEETAFTDAVYRSNQAFEGSIKEAYRVLAGKEPSHKTPHEIEKYLEQNEIFRPRILDLFKNYRTEWRNPSTHDYKLVFDASEAFLAIVSVSAFACLLLDQIAEKTSYQKAKNATDAQKEIIKKALPKKTDNLLDRVAKLFAEFSMRQQLINPSKKSRPEVQVLGALGGFLASAAPDISATMDQPLAEGRKERADMILSDASEQVLVEIKRATTSTKLPFSALNQVGTYLELSGIKRGILYYYSDEETNVERTDIDSIKTGNLTVMLQPVKTKSGKKTTGKSLGSPNAVE